MNAVLVRIEEDAEGLIVTVSREDGEVPTMKTRPGYAAAVAIKAIRDWLNVQREGGLM